MMAVEQDDSFDFLPQQNPHRHLEVHTQRLQSQVKLPPMPPREEFPFLRADHPFDATSLADPGSPRDPAAICLSFGFGDVVYVHYVHSSGWGDVTLVRTAERGWIPVDYFSGFTDARAIPLLAAIASFIARPRSQRIYHASGEEGLTFNEAAINEIISGTKLLLSKTDTLSRDSPLVASVDAIRAARKALLTELAHIVYIAKNNKYSTRLDVIDKLVRGCFRTLTSATALMDAVDAPDVETDFSAAGAPQEPPLPPRSPQRSPQKSLQKSSQKLPQKPLPKSPHKSERDADPPFRSDASRRSSHSQASQRSVSASDWDDSQHPLNRIRSFVDHSHVPQPVDRLHEVAGAFVGYLSNFLDPSALLKNSDSPETSPAILAVTRHCMLACRELLVVFDSVTSTSAVTIDSFENDKDLLLGEIRKLVSAARSVVAALPPAPASLRAVATQNLVVVAARCNDLGLKCSRQCATLLKGNPAAELPGSRSYPVFEGDNTVELDLGLGFDVPPAAHIRDARGSNDQTDAKSDHIVTTTSLAASANRPSSRSTDTVESTVSGVDSMSTGSVASRSSVAIDPLDSSARLASGSEIRLPKTQRQNQWPSTTSVGQVPAADGPADATAVGATSSKEDLPVPSAQGLSQERELVYRNDKVRGGTLPALVDWLAGTDQPEFEMRVFLLCFRLFASARDVLLELGAREPSRSVRHFATTWIESFWADDDSVLKGLAMIADPALIKARQQLTTTGPKNAQLAEIPLTSETAMSANSSTTSVASMSSVSSSKSRRPSAGTSLGRQQFSGSSALNLANSFREFSLGARRASRRTSQDETTFRRIMSGSSVSSTPEDTGDGVEYLLSRTPQDIANQFTLMWADIFAAMRASELIDQRFASSKRSLRLAPNVNQLVLSSNHLTSFVGDTILSTDVSSRQRAKVVKHWLRVADEMFTMGNLNGVVTVILTLQSTRISRLRKVWESVGPKSQSILAKLAPFTSPERNFSEYRKELRRRVGQPCVPYIGILLGDLTFIDEGNPRVLKLESGAQAINFDRYMKAGTAISTVQQFQRLPFQLPADPSLQAWLRGRSAKSHSVDSRNAQDQWRRSVLIQPE